MGRDVVGDEVGSETTEALAGACVRGTAIDVAHIALRSGGDGPGPELRQHAETKCDVLALRPADRLAVITRRVDGRSGIAHGQGAVAVEQNDGDALGGDRLCPDLQSLPTGPDPVPCEALSGMWHDQVEGSGRGMGARGQWSSQASQAWFTASMSWFG